jgi:uncharacterized integral membrane protein (TIGR00697 family)
MDMLIGLYIFCIFASEVMGAKSFPLFSIFGYQLNASVAIFLLPLVYSINDVVTEVYGKQRMQQLMKVGLVIIVLIILVSAFFTSLPTTERFAEMHPAYVSIFHMGIRMSIASLLSFLIANILDIYVFSLMRKKMQNQKLRLRTNVSNIISEFFDTFIFLIIAFYAVHLPFANNASFILSIGIPYWILKCGMSFLTTPFVYYGVKILSTTREIKS